MHCYLFMWYENTTFATSKLNNKHLSRMTKEDLNQMCREYQQVLVMSEEEVFAMYEESKSECIASFEAEIDFWENYYGY